MEYVHNTTRQKFVKVRSNATHVVLKEDGVPSRLAFETEVTYEELHKLYTPVNITDAVTPIDDADEVINEGWC